jgi:hypothetical protein
MTTIVKGTICDLQGNPLVNNAHIELDEEEGVTSWGGHFRLPQPAPSLDLFRPQCIVQLADGRQGKITIGRHDRTAAYFLGNGKLAKGPVATAASAQGASAKPAA